MNHTDYYNTFFSKHDMNMMDHPDKMSNAELMTYLDDIVQILALESSNQWGTSNDAAHRAFRGLKQEISKRLK